MNLMEAAIAAKLGGGGGGGASVTPASIVSATGQMTAQQKAETRANIGATDAETSIPDNVKDALLDCFAHVAWTNEHGQDYYDALEAALYPPVDLVSISAVYTQSGTVYNTDSLDSLRDDLVVTATYSNGDVLPVTAYILSGTLEVGTSTITVNYGVKTATFAVNVTRKPIIDGTTLTWERGYIDADGNIAVSPDVGGYTSDYYDVSGYQTVLVALDGSTTQRNAYYAGNKTFISRALTAESEIPNGAVYARASVIKSSLGNDGYDGTGTTITLS